jgi:hypothetical protein
MAWIRVADDPTAAVPHQLTDGLELLFNADELQFIPTAGYGTYASNYSAGAYAGEIGALYNGTVDMLTNGRLS